MESCFTGKAKYSYSELGILADTVLKINSMGPHSKENNWQHFCQLQNAVFQGQIRIWENFIFAAMRPTASQYFVVGCDVKEFKKKIL